MIADLIILFCLGLAFIAPAVIAIYWGRRSQERMAAWRSKALNELARRWEVDFSREDPYNLPLLLRRFQIFRVGSGNAYNVLSGNRNGRELIAFDCGDPSRSADRETPACLSVLVIADRVRWPGLLIQQKPPQYNIIVDAEFKNIHFESDEFNRRFCIQGPDRQFAYDVINAQMMEYLMANAGWHLELYHDYLMIADGDEWNASRFEEALAMAEGFLERMPKFVWKDWRTDEAAIENSVTTEEQTGTEPKRFPEKPGTR
jgi:hypothetical protein